MTELYFGTGIVIGLVILAATIVWSVIDGELEDIMLVIVATLNVLLSAYIWPLYIFMAVVAGATAFVRDKYDL